MDCIKNNNQEASAVGGASDVALVFKLGGSTGSRSTTSVDGNGTTTNKRKASSLPNQTVEYLKAWMMSPEHIAHPYPTEAEKAKIMEDTGIEMKQLTNWFVNNRKRYWKPRVEARLREQKMVEKASQHLCSSVSKDSSDGESPAHCKPAVVSPRRRGSSTTGFASSSSSLATKSTQPKTTMFPSLSGTSPNTIRTVSVHSSMVSLNDLVSSDDDEPPARQRQQQVSSISKTKSDFQVVQHKDEPTAISETVNVHILRPTNGSAMPQISDVTVLSNVPQERILRTFENCAVHYSAPAGKSSPSRRDAEIVRIKKHYLAVYLTEMAASVMAMNYNNNDKKRQPMVGSSVHVVTPDAELPVEPRRKYRRVSVELWKEACQTANHVYDRELPSLEEATQLFGYTSS